MEKRKNLISGIISVVMVDLLIATITAIGYIGSHNQKIIIAGLVFILLGDMIAILNVQVNRKEHDRVARIVRNALSEQSLTKVAPSEGNEETYIFEFLEDVCTFYAMLAEGDEDEVKIIGEIQINDQSRTIDYKLISFEDFVNDFIVID